MDPQTHNDQGIPMAEPPQSAPVSIAAPVPAVEPPLPSMTSAPVPVTTAPIPAAATPLPKLSNAPAVAADNDVIEPEWILKAKQIVTATRDDPYRQVQQLNQLKSEYMQKRYNKTIKLPDA
jgi:hypothetical protein